MNSRLIKARMSTAKQKANFVREQKQKFAENQSNKLASIDANMTWRTTFPNRNPKQQHDGSFVRCHGGISRLDKTSIDINYDLDSLSFDENFSQQQQQQQQQHQQQRQQRHQRNRVVGSRSPSPPGSPLPMPSSPGQSGGQLGGRFDLLDDGGGADDFGGFGKNYNSYESLAVHPPTQEEVPYSSDKTTFYSIQNPSAYSKLLLKTERMVRFSYLFE